MLSSIAIAGRSFDWARYCIVLYQRTQTTNYLTTYVVLRQEPNNGFLAQVVEELRIPIPRTNPTYYRPRLMYLSTSTIGKMSGWDLRRAFFSLTNFPRIFHFARP